MSSYASVDTHRGLAGSIRHLAEQVRASQGIVLRDPRLVVAEAALAPILDDAGTAMLVRPQRAAADVRVRHHLVNAVGSSWHEVSGPDHVFIGAMGIGRADVAAAADALDDLASAIESGSIAADADDVIRLCAVAVVRAGISCKAIDLVDVPWFLAPDDRDAAEAAVATVSPERIARLQANRVDDGFYSTFVVRKLSKPMTAVALRLGMSPNLITLISFGVGLLAAGSFALGDRWALVIGAILLQLSLIIDCVDGEVARAT
ncbi:MAG: CDP-alcohol phosphatidyltransferase family protein, partial [Candidatus Nanopelagicales bacterium]